MVWGAVSVLALSGCASVDPPILGVCGNGIVEPDGDEACEVGTPGCGSPDGEHPCRWTCDEENDCPESWSCGADALCRQSSGVLGTPVQLSEDETHWVMPFDVDGDGVDEITTQGSSGAFLRMRIFGREGGAGELGLRATLDAEASDRQPALVRHAGRSFAVVPAVREGAPWGEREALAVYDVTDGEGVRLFIPEVVLPSSGYPVPVRGMGGDAVAVLREDGSADAVLGDLPDALLNASTLMVSEPFPRAQLGWPVRTDGTTGIATDWLCPVQLNPLRDSPVPLAVNACVGELIDMVGQEEPIVLPAATTLDLPSLPNENMRPIAAFGDVNGDGLDDYAAQELTGAVHLAYAVGDGTFHDDPATLPATGGNGLSAQIADMPEAMLAVGDFNDDGVPDVITTSEIVFGCPGGSQSCPLPSVSLGALPSSTVVDFDGNGLPDLVGQSAADAAELRVLHNYGKDGVAEWVLPREAGTTILGAGDLDMDGRDDVVAASQREDDSFDIDVVFGGAAGASVPIAGGFESVAAATTFRDASRGGLPRVALVGSRPGSAAEGLYTMGLDASRNPDLGGDFRVPNSWARTLVVGAFDPVAPDRPVLAVLSEGRGEQNGRSLASIWGAVGEEAFPPEVALVEHELDPLPPNWFNEALAVAVDLNADGLDEIVTVGVDSFSNSGAVGVIEFTSGEDGHPVPVVASYEVGLPEGYIQSLPGSLETPYVSHPIDTYDVDADGDADVLALGYVGTDPVLVAWVNEGTGSLASGSRLGMQLPDPEGDRWRSFAVVGGDTQALEVILSGFFRPTTRWMVDLEGEATMSAEEVPGAPMSPGVAWVDGDGDGLKDLFLAGPTGLFWMRNLPAE